MMSYLNCSGPSQGPIFCLEDGSPLTRSGLSDFIQKKTVAAGWTVDFTTHSFRKGPASTAAMLDIPHYLIKALGRWSSDAYQLYIRSPDERLAQISEKLGNVLTV